MTGNLDLLGHGGNGRTNGHEEACRNLMLYLFGNSAKAVGEVLLLRAAEEASKDATVSDEIRTEFNLFIDRRSRHAMVQDTWAQVDESVDEHARPVNDDLIFPTEIERPTSALSNIRMSALPAPYDLALALDRLASINDALRNGHLSEERSDSVVPEGDVREEMLFTHQGDVDGIGSTSMSAEILGLVWRDANSHRHEMLEARWRTRLYQPKQIWMRLINEFKKIGLQLPQFIERNRMAFITSAGMLLVALTLASFHWITDKVVRYTPVAASLHSATSSEHSFMSFGHGDIKTPSLSNFSVHPAPKISATIPCSLDELISRGDLITHSCATRAPLSRVPLSDESQRTEAGPPSIPLYAGLLSCTVSSHGRSTSNMNCSFDQAWSGSHEVYVGRIFYKPNGRTLTAAAGKRMKWEVYRPSADSPNGGLSGTYNYGGKRLLASSRHGSRSPASTKHTHAGHSSGEDMPQAFLVGVQTNLIANVAALELQRR
jgi:hypothetical protein